MTALDQTAPLPAERLAEIRRRDEISLGLAEKPDWPLGQAEWDRTVLLAEVDRLKAREQELHTKLANEEATSSRLLDERDDMETLLNKFAYAIAPEEVIGEHSSGNDPWENALDLLTPAAEVDRLSSERDKARETARHTTNAMVKVGTELMRALREANTSGAEAGMAVVRDLMTDMPSPIEAEPQDGGKTP